MNYKVIFEDKIKQDSIVFYKADILNLSTGESRKIHVRHQVISELHDKLENNNGYSQQLPSFPSKHSLKQVFGIEKKENMINRLNKYFEQLIAKPPIMSRPLQEFLLLQKDQLRKYNLRDRVEKEQYWDNLLKKFTKIDKLKKRCNRFIKFYEIEFEGIKYLMKRFTLPRLELSGQLCKNYVDLQISIADFKHIVKAEIIFQISKRKQKENVKKQWFKGAFNFQKQQPEPQPPPVQQLNQKETHPYIVLFPPEKFKLLPQSDQEGNFQYLVCFELIQGYSIEGEFLTRRQTNTPFDFDTILDISQSMSQGLNQIHKIRDYAHRKIDLQSICKGTDNIWRLWGPMEPVYQYMDKWNQLQGNLKEILQIPPEKRENEQRGFLEIQAQKGDIYQLGLVLLRICTLCTTQDLLEEVNGENSKKLLYRIIEDRYGYHFSQIINQMVSLNPAERPSSYELVNFFFQTQIVPMKLDFLSQPIIKRQKQRWRRIRLEYDPNMNGQDKVIQLVVNKPNNFHDLKQLINMSFSKIEEAVIDLKNTNLNNQHLIDLEATVKGLKSLTLDISEQQIHFFLFYLKSNKDVTLDGLCLFLNMLRQVKSLKKLKIYAFQFSQTPYHVFESEGETELKISVITEQD